MAKHIKNQYNPDYVPPPGETIAETIECMGMSRAELARRIGCTPETINGIIQGETAITPEMAMRLEQVLGVPSGFWIRKEFYYRKYLSKGKRKWSNILNTWEMICRLSTRRV